MFLNFELFSLLKYYIGFQDCISENTYQNSKQGRPDQTASSEAVWSGSALFVLAFVAGDYCLNF